MPGSARGVVFGSILLSGILIGLTVLVAIGLGFTSGTWDYLTKGLPPVDHAFEAPIFQTGLITDREGHQLYEIWDPDGGRRTIIPLSEMPQSLVDATLATEDARYYENPGFETAAIIRAFWQNIRGQAIISGGSTITQQVVRASLLTDKERYDRSYLRKAKEIILAYQLSQRYTKEEILERYLNEIPYGNLSYGVEAAAESYFGKAVKDLTVGEAALLAGLPQSPSAYDPLNRPRAALTRQSEVLALMVKHGYLTPRAAAVAERQQLHFSRATVDLEAPHFTMYVRGQLDSRLTRQQIYYDGVQVKTSLDLNLQGLAESVIDEYRDQIAEQGANNVALVAIDPRNGQIVAMVGSADYWNDSIDGQINMALADRQPGPTLKPFIYLAAFARGTASPVTLMQDEPAVFSGGRNAPSFRPENPDGKFRGTVTARRALANSLNVPAARLLSRIGVAALLETAHEMGITGLVGDPSFYGLSLATGAGDVSLIDLTYAYVPLANGGVQVGEPVPESEQAPGQRQLQPSTIVSISDAQGRVLLDNQSSGRVVIGPQVAWLITNILSDDQARQEVYGPNSSLKLSRPSAAVAGYTENYLDNVAVGYTPDLVVGVWVGNTSGAPMRPGRGPAVAGAIWHGFMEDALKGLPATGFDRPPGLVLATVDAHTGTRPGPDAETITDWFVEGNVPRQWALPTPTASPVPTATPTATPTPAPSPTPAPTATPSTDSVEQPVDSGMVEVPNLIGRSEADARRIVDGLGLTNTYANYQNADEVPDRSFARSIDVGSVLSQTPSPGTRVAAGATVYLAVRGR